MRSSCLVLAMIAVLSVPVRAEPSAPAPVATPVASYRVEVVGVDAASLALMIGGVASSSSSDQGLFGTLGASVFVLGAPILHFAHGRGERAAASLVLRIAPLVAGYAIYHSADGCGQFDDICWSHANHTQLVGVAVGAIGGLVAAVIDTWAFAGADEHAGPAAIVPAVRVAGGATTFGLAGSF